MTDNKPSERLIAELIRLRHGRREQRARADRLQAEVDRIRTELDSVNQTLDRLFAGDGRDPNSRPAIGD
jgi:uncharacterized coiled-coil DUF342 family protein